MTTHYTAADIIADSVQSDSNIILEDRAKAILKEFGVPVVTEVRVSTSREAAGAARAMGFPVVIKGIGKNLAHKTEQGMVRVGVATPDDVYSVSESLLDSGVEGIQGLLVQPMVQGKRELVAGMFRDPQFGAVIMFGFGGIFTEAVKDVVFRLAPLDTDDMDQMMDELNARILLDDFRGEAAADRSQIKAVLKGISDLAVRFPDLREIDINPLIITPGGDLIAVDALMVTGKETSTLNRKPLVEKQDIGRLFYPNSVAFVGASETIGKWGHMLLTNTLSGGYQGKVFLVNPRGGIIAGREVYKSLSDINEPIDLAVVTIPADRVLGLIPELKAKHVRGILLITSGFGETGAAGAALEKELIREAQAAGIVVLGPNTMGICNPHKRFYCSGAHVHPIPGSTALVCQSGNMGTQLLAFAEQQDIGIRAFSGSGNEAMVTIEDYMEVFETDDKTRTVVLYIESVKDGRRFFESAARVSKTKPVVILSGGRTKAGGKAASSHTGAMASDARVFRAACRQAGVIQVNQPMELMDLSTVFSSLPLPRGNRVAIMTLGGGWGVVTADLCSEYGLTIPELSEPIVARLDKLLPPYWSRSNPVDLVGENDPEIPMVAVEELLKWDGCDAVLHLGIHGKRIFGEKMVDSIAAVDPGYTRETLDSIKEMMFNYEQDYIDHIIRLMERYRKPVIGVSLLTDSRTKSLYGLDGFTHKGVFFASPERAVKALSGMVRYQSWLDRKAV